MFGQMSQVGRFDDPMSVASGGLIDEDRVNKKRVLQLENVRKALVQRIGNNIEGAFKKFDKDNSGGIDYKEMREAIRDLGISDEVGGLDDIERLIKAIDTNGDGVVSLSEFNEFLNMDLSKQRTDDLHDLTAERRRQAMTGHSKPEPAACSISFAKQADTQLQSKYGCYANGARVTKTRRTSYALGLETQREVFTLEFQYRVEKMREQARKALAGRISNSGGMKSLFDRCDTEKKGWISFKQLKRGLDLLGLSVLHQDSQALMDVIDDNGDGKITMEEMKAYMEADQLELSKKAEAVREERERNAAVGGTPRVLNPADSSQHGHLMPTLASARKSIRMVVGDDAGSSKRWYDGLLNSPNSSTSRHVGLPPPQQPQQFLPTNSMSASANLPPMDLSMGSPHHRGIRLMAPEQTGNRLPTNRSAYTRPHQNLVPFPPQSAHSPRSSPRRKPRQTGWDEGALKARARALMASYKPRKCRCCSAMLTAIMNTSAAASAPHAHGVPVSPMKPKMNRNQRLHDYRNRR